MAVITFIQQHCAASKSAKTKDALSDIAQSVDMVISADIGQNACIGML